MKEPEGVDDEYVKGGKGEKEEEEKRTNSSFQRMRKDLIVVSRSIAPLLCPRPSSVDMSAQLSHFELPQLLERKVLSEAAVGLRECGGREGVRRVTPRRRR
jgi:hypothetical protein